MFFGPNPHQRAIRYADGQYGEFKEAGREERLTY